MKRTASLLVLLVAGFVVGCQDGSITDPATRAVSDGTRFSKTQPANTVPLAALLREPGTVFNSLVEVVGALQYRLTVIPLDPIPPNPQFAVQLHIDATAELRPYEPGVPPPSTESVWVASGSSDDLLPIPESGAVVITRRYRVQGRSDAVLLAMSLRVTITGIEVTRIWLELPLGEGDVERE